MPPALHSSALLDANVLYPAPVRDLFLHLASKGLYSPMWSTDIQREWKLSLLKSRKDFPVHALNMHGVHPMHPDAFASAMVQHAPQAVVAAIKKHVSMLVDPPVTETEVVNTLQACGLGQFASLLKPHLGLPPT